MSGVSRLQPTSLVRGPSLTLTIAVLAFAVAVIVTTEFIVVGLLPMMARDLDVAIHEAGWLVTWFALSSALLGPPLTMTASRVEPRPVLLVALVVFALGNLAAAAVPSYPILVGVRILQGAALPVFVSVSNAAVGRMAGPGREGRAIALLNVGVVVGAVLGVPAGVLLANQAGWATSFVLLAALATIATGLVRAGFPRGVRHGLASMRTQAAIVADPSLQAHLLLSAALFMAMFAAYTYLAELLEVVAGFDGSGIAISLMGFGIAGLFGNWIAGRMVDRDPMMTTAAAALTLMIVMSAISFAGEAVTVLVPLLACWGAAHAAAFLICQVRVMLAGTTAPAFAASLNISACNLGIALGAIVGGGIVERYGVAAIGFGSAALATVAFAIAGVMMARPFARRSLCRS